MSVHGQHPELDLHPLPHPTPGRRNSGIRGENDRSAKLQSRILET